MYYIIQPNELRHHGIKGQKWYVRRFQNEDGSYTEAGKTRYAKTEHQKARRRRTAAVGGLLYLHHEKRRKEKEEERKRQERRERAPALIGLAAGTALMTAAVLAARHQDQIDEIVSQAALSVVTKIPGAVVSTGKKAISGILGAIDFSSVSITFA